MWLYVLKNFSYKTNIKTIHSLSDLIMALFHDDENAC